MSAMDFLKSSSASSCFLNEFVSSSTGSLVEEAAFLLADAVASAASSKFLRTVLSFSASLSCSVSSDAPITASPAPTP